MAEETSTPRYFLLLASSARSSRSSFISLASRSRHSRSAAQYRSYCVRCEPRRPSHERASGQREAARAAPTPTYGVGELLQRRRVLGVELGRLVDRRAQARVRLGLGPRRHELRRLVALANDLAIAARARANTHARTRFDVSGREFGRATVHARARGRDAGAAGTKTGGPARQAFEIPPHAPAQHVGLLVNRRRELLLRVEAHLGLDVQQAAPRLLAQSAHAERAECGGHRVFALSVGHARVRVHTLTTALFLSRRARGRAATTPRLHFGNGGGGGRGRVLVAVMVILKVEMH